MKKLLIDDNKKSLMYKLMYLEHSQIIITLLKKMSILLVKCMI